MGIVEGLHFASTDGKEVVLVMVVVEPHLARANRPEQCGYVHMYAQEALQLVLRMLSTQFPMSDILNQARFFSLNYFANGWRKRGSCIESMGVLLIK